MNDFFPRRINELVDAFFASWRRGQTACEAMRFAASCPCSRFWISEEAAKKHVWRIRKHGIQCVRNRLTREMMREIMHRCNGDFSPINVERVVNSPAPMFYIEPETARRLIQKELKRRRQCRRKQSR